MRILFKILLLLLIATTLIHGTINLFNEVENPKTQPPIAPVPDKTRYELKLYFGNHENNGLVIENRVVITSEQNEEKIIIEELIKGPRNKTLNSSIPPKTQLLAIKTEDGICYVNFSNEFLSVHKWDKMNEAITIWSIVNSLTELKHIDAVQILVDGNKEEVFKKFYSLKRLFYRNEELLIKEVPTPFIAYNHFLDALKSGNYKQAYEMLDTSSIKRYDFVKFKLIMGSYARGLKEYEIFRYQTQKYSTGVVLIIRFRKKNTSFADLENDIIERWQLVNENGVWKIVLPS